jgi:hypothetical protein
MEELKIRFQYEFPLFGKQGSGEILSAINLIIFSHLLRLGSPRKDSGECPTFKPTGFRTINATGRSFV